MIVENSQSQLSGRCQQYYEDHLHFEVILFIKPSSFLWLSYFFFVLFNFSFQRNRKFHFLQEISSEIQNLWEDHPRVADEAVALVEEGVGNVLHELHVLQDYLKLTSSVVKWYLKCVLKGFQWCFKGFSFLLLMCFLCVSWLCQACLKGITRVCKSFFYGVSWVFLLCFLSVIKGLQVGLKCVLNVFQECFRGILRLIHGCFKCVSWVILVPFFPTILILKVIFNFDSSLIFAVILTLIIPGYFQNNLSSLLNPLNFQHFDGFCKFCFYRGLDMYIKG